MPTFRNTLSHLHRRVGMKCDWGWECGDIYTGKGLARKIAWANRMGGDGVGAVWNQEYLMKLCCEFLTYSVRHCDNFTSILRRITLYRPVFYVTPKCSETEALMKRFQWLVFLPNDKDVGMKCVGTMARLRDGRSGVWIPVRVRDFSLTPNF
jgi:hypothetical protein